MAVRIQRSALRSTFARLDRHGSDLRPYLRVVGKMQQRSAAEEFRRGAFFDDRGRVIPWLKGHDFGSRKAPRRTLVRSGSLERAVSGRGVGSILRVGPKSVQVGVDDGRFPHAKHLRGGTGQRLTRSPAIIKPKKRARSRSTGRFLRGARHWAMTWKVFSLYGFFFRAKTLRRGLRLPRRAWGIFHPRLRRGSQELASQYILTGRAVQPPLRSFTP